MCLIVECKPGRELPLSVWENFATKNRDGAGFMWVKDGVVHRSRLLQGKNTKARDVYLMHKALVRKGLGHYAHLRFATHGSVTKDNVHPFEVLPDVMLMHNGVISPQRYNHNYGYYGEGGEPELGGESRIATHYLDDDAWPYLHARRSPIIVPHVPPNTPVVVPPTRAFPTPPAAPTTPALLTTGTATAKPKDSRSDTAIFVDDHLRPYLKKYLETHTREQMYDFIESEPFRLAVIAEAGYSSKIVIMTPKGPSFFPVHNNWTKLDEEEVPGAGGVLVSNTYAWDNQKWKNRSTVVTYHPNGNGGYTPRQKPLQFKYRSRKHNGQQLSKEEEAYLDRELELLSLMQAFRSLDTLAEVEKEVRASPREVAQLLRFLIDGSVDALKEEK